MRSIFFFFILCVCTRVRTLRGSRVSTHPGPIKYLFMVIFAAEDYLKMTPEERKLAAKKRRDKILGKRDPRFAPLYKIPQNKDEAKEWLEVFKVMAKEEFEKKKVRLR